MEGNEISDIKCIIILSVDKLI